MVIDLKGNDGGRWSAMSCKVGLSGTKESLEGDKKRSGGFMKRSQKRKLRNSSDRCGALADGTQPIRESAGRRA